MRLTRRSGAMAPQEVHSDDENDRTEGDVQRVSQTRTMTIPVMCSRRISVDTDVSIHRSYDFANIQADKGGEMKEQAQFVGNESHQADTITCSSEDDDENFQDESCAPSRNNFTVWGQRTHDNNMHTYYHFSDRIGSSQSQPLVTMGGIEEPFKGQKKRQAGHCGCLTRKGLVGLVGFIALALVGAVLGALHWSNSENLPSPLQHDDSSPREAPNSTKTTPPTLDHIGVAVWQQYTGTRGSGFGSAVVIQENWVAIGSPQGDSVSTYFQRPGGYWERVEDVVPYNGEPSLFGSTIDFCYNMSRHTTPYMIVGAPEAAGGGNAHVYEYLQYANGWKLMDAPLFAPGEATERDDAKFGSSVVIIENRKVVIGAPQYGTDNRGSVFTFQYKLLGSDGAQETYGWVPVASATVSGSSANAHFGADLDITSDGNTLVVGEPNQNKFTIFDWVETDKVWKESFTFTSAREHIDFGSSVVFLSSSFVAVGAPSANSDAGLVSLFEKDTRTDTWSFRQSFQGEASDRLGAKGRVSGSHGPWGTQLAVATQKGYIQRHDLVVLGTSSYVIVKRYTVNITSATSIDVEADEDGFVVVAGYGHSDLVFMYGPPYETDDSETPETTKDPNSKQIQGEMVGSNTLSDGERAYGSAVGVTGDVLVVGQPLQNKGAGSAEILYRSSKWTPMDSIAKPGTQEFGSAISLRLRNGKFNLLVGSKSSAHGSTSLANYGSAHYYEFNEDKSWSQVGQSLYPGFHVDEAGGEFGAAVAMSSGGPVRRIAVGAPSSSTGSFNYYNGRVFTFQYNGTSWESMASPSVGSPKSFLGSAVDMNADGSRLLGGAPGADKAFYSTWNEASSSWDEVFAAKGKTGEAFGSSVAVASDDGTLIAVGGPAYDGGRGVIRMYSQQSEGNSFLQVGDDIIGNIGEGVGLTLCGRKGRIAVGTEFGFFRVYSVDAGKWQEIAHGGVEGSPVVSIAMSEDGETIATGLANEQVWVYNIS